jgi:tetratricopeptide (TPR) repeat protein
VEWEYEIRLEKEGYQTKAEPLRFAIGGTVTARWVLAPKGAAVVGDSGADAGGGGGGSKAVRTYNEGVEAQRLGDSDLAAESYRKAAKLDPELAAAHTSLAAISLQREDYSTAAAEAETALAIDPGDVRAMRIRFDAYRLAGETTKADEAAKALRDIGDLGDAAARIFNEGVDAYNGGAVAAAQSKFQQVVQLDPEMVAPYVALAQISLAQGSAAEAAAMAQSALERDPDNVRALRIAFDSARLTGDAEAAAQALERLVELDPQWVTTTLFDHAAELFNENRVADAAIELEYVVKADPDLARAHYLLGMALFNTGRADEGRVHLQKFLEFAPDDPDAEIARGLLSYQQ